MGQTASKAAARLSNRLASAAERHPPAPGTAAAAARRGGGGAGTGAADRYQQRDAAQHAFLQERSRNAPQEMPPDLLSFLQDAGPLQRKDEATVDAAPVITPRRPPKIPGLDPSQPPVQSAVSETSAANVVRVAPDDPTRVRQVLPLLRGAPDFGTERTTSFSYRAEEADADTGGLDILDLYQLLAQPSDGSNEMDQLPEATGAGSDDAARLRRLARQYLENPVLLKDEDDTYVGAHARDVDRIVAFLRLRRTAPTQVRLVVEDLAEARDRGELPEVSQGLGL